VLESISDAFVAVDREWRLTYINKEAELLTDAERTAVVGKSFWDAFPTFGGPEERPPFDRAMANAEPTAFEVRHAPSGSWLQARAYPTEDGISLYLSDVTEQKEAQEVLRRFIANAAHELRNPLAGVVGMAGLIGERRDRMSQEQIEEALQHVGEQGTRLNSLIGDLLDLSQLDHATAPELGSVDLRAVAAEAIQVAPPPTGRSVSLDIPAWITVESDAKSLVRIFINLLTNAYKYGGPSIRLEAEPSRASVLASVTDDGDGIPPELSERVFEAFSRGPNAEAGTSFGLGLAIVKSLAKRAGGDIWYEPATPHGTRFVLLLRQS
jgi:hypothetical protein